MINLPKKLDEECSKRIKAFPCHSNRASSLGAACTRQLVYGRTQWAQATLPEVGAKRVFELGERVERDVIRLLVDAGLEVVEQQRALDDFADCQITGHVDGVLLVDGKAVPFDVKSMAPHIWDRIAAAGPGVYAWSAVAPEFEKRPWLKKYRAQIMLYALCKNSEYGILLCFNKSTAELAQIEVPLDYDYCDWLLDRAKEINRHVAADTLPDRIPWDADECGHCSYLHLCLPDRVGKDPVMFIPDAEIVRCCLAREIYQEAADTWEKVDATVKEWAKASAWERCLVTNGTDSFEVTKTAQARGVRVAIKRALQSATVSQEEATA